MLKTRHILIAAILGFLSFGATANAAVVGHVSTPATAEYVLEAQRSVSPAEAKSIARKRVPGGDVVDISRKGDTYFVKVIAPNGKVVIVYIDVNTGRVKR